MESFLASGSTSKTATTILKRHQNCTGYHRAISGEQLALHIGARLRRPTAVFGRDKGRLTNLNFCHQTLIENISASVQINAMGIRMAGILKHVTWGNTMAGLLKSMTWGNTSAFKWLAF
jgi:hypothetical protein